MRYWGPSWGLWGQSCYCNILGLIPDTLLYIISSLLLLPFIFCCLLFNKRKNVKYSRDIDNSFYLLFQVLKVFPVSNNSFLVYISNNLNNVISFFRSSSRIDSIVSTNSIQSTVYCLAREDVQYLSALKEFSLDNFIQILTLIMFCSLAPVKLLF